MAKPSFRWESEPEVVFTSGFNRYAQEVIATIQAICLKYQPIVENWMKDNAKWTDRTGNARQALYADVEELAMGAALILDHGMDYGVFLELSMQGTYQIIKPALDEFGPKIWDEVKRMLA